ncbi:hypothetical protein [Sandaracinus amylolyticus]|uniref:hypothetical protein n=1 Tax=Sandaracinus amylolyticus TaxID=927083 RepID=UPI001F38D46D|nr:hypothetical protein [Sandaracinus amylolyticus]
MSQRGVVGTLLVVVLGCGGTPEVRGASGETVASGSETSAPVSSTPASATQRAFRSIALAESTTWVVRADGTLACVRDGEPVQTITEIDGATSVTAGFVSCVTTEGGRVRCVRRCEASAEIEDMPLPFASDRVVVDGVHDRVCARASEGGDLACVTRGAQELLVSGTSEVHGGYGAVYAIDDRGTLWCAGEGACARAVAASAAIDDLRRAEEVGAWPPLGEMTAVPPTAIAAAGRVRRLALDEGMVCAERDDGAVVCWGELFAPVEVPAVRGADELVSWAARICARRGGRVECVRPAAHDEVLRLPVEGVVSLASRGMRLCAETREGALSCTRFGGPHAEVVFSPVEL